MLSKKEMRTILAGTNVQAMIGAGLQGRLNDSLDLALLERATGISPTNSLAWAALAYRSLELLENQLGDRQATGKKFSKAIEMWRAISPSNSVPIYLQAAFECLKTNVAGAKELTVKASRIRGFETCETALKLCIIQALEAAGYSKFTSRIVASGNSSGIVPWSKLNKAVLADNPTDEEARACIELGARVARSRSFLYELVRGSIQIKAMEKVGGAEFATARKEIAERKDRIKSANRYLTSTRAWSATETQWIEFSDRSFKSDEMEGARWLAQQTGDTF